MVRRPRLSRPTRLLLVAVLTGGQFVVVGAAPSRAAGDALDNGAVGAFVNVAQGDNPAIRSGPLLPLDMAPAGAVRDAELPSMAVSAADGGSVLTTGRIVVSAGSGEQSPSAASSTSVEALDALAGVLTAERAGSTCDVAPDVAAHGATSLVGGRLAVSSSETVSLPDEPAPNQTFRGHSDALDTGFTVVLNSQTALGGITSVSAVRMVLEGPDITGEIVIGRSLCGSPAPETQAPAADLAMADEADAVAGVRVAAAPPAATSSQLGTRSAAAAAIVTEVTANSFNYFTNVSLFGGPSMRRGYGQQICTGANVPAGCVPAATAPSAASPAESCPAGGGSPSSIDNDGAKAQYGPAVIFGGIWPDDFNAAPPSGPLRASIDCKLGEGGFARASTDQTLMPSGSAYPGGAGPGPFIANEVHSSCSASETGVTGTTSVVNGKVETKYDPVTQAAVTTVPVAPNPPRNTTVTGTIDHVGDSFRIVLNEQTSSSDGTLTVTAMHMFLLGPTAVGEMVIGQSVCGVRAQAGTTTSSTTAGGTSSTTTGGDAGTTSTSAASGTTAGSGSSGGTSGTSGTGTGTGSSSGAGSGSTGVAGTSTARSGSGNGAAGNPLALTGGTQQLALAMFLALAGLLASRWARTRRKPEPARTE